MAHGTMAHGTLLLLGSGPGIGVHVAKLFAERGFRRVVLASRDAGRLAKEVEEVKDAAASAGAEVEVRAVTMDLGSKEGVRVGLGEVEKFLSDGDGEGRLEAVVFNAARVGMSKMFEFTEREIEDDFQISVTSLYTIAAWALPKLVVTAEAGDAAARPSLLVTSGGLAKDPYPQLFSLALCKAAQYNLVGSLHKAYAPQGVHCALVVVRGFVKPDAQVTTPRNVAEKMWELLMQECGRYELDVDIVDPAYKYK